MRKLIENHLRHYLTVTPLRVAGMLSVEALWGGRRRQERHLGAEDRLNKQEGILNRPILITNPLDRCNELRDFD